jgi:hypothetical protein
MKQYYPLKDFSLGLNDKVVPDLIDDRELAEATNVLLNPLRKRNGFESYANCPAPIKKLYEFRKTNGTEYLVVADKLYIETNGTCAAVTGTTGTAPFIKMVTTKDRSTNDVVLIADGSTLKRYNGTDVQAVTPRTPTTQEQENPGLNDLSFLTTFRTMTMHKGRLYAAAHPVHKNRVSFSHIDPTLGYSVYDYFPAVNFFDVAISEGDEVMEIRTFRDVLAIFCKRSIWALYGNTTADFQLLKINVPTGCVSPKSVTTVGNNIFYLSDTHVYALYATDFGTVSAQIISDKVEGTLKGIALSDKEKACGVFYDNKYYLSFPNGMTLVYDVLLQAWTKFTNVQANSFLVRDGSLYFGSEDKNVYRFSDIYNDNGQPISMQVKLKRLDFDDGGGQQMVAPKKLRRIWIQSKQYEASASGYTIDAVLERETKRLVTNMTNNDMFPKWDSAKWDTDVWDAVPHQNPNSAKWDEAVWDSSRWDFLEVQQEEIKVKEKARTLQLVISNDTLNQPVTIYRIDIEFKPKRP